MRLVKTYCFLTPLQTSIQLCIILLIDSPCIPLGQKTKKNLFRFFSLQDSNMELSYMTRMRQFDAIMEAQAQLTKAPTSRPPVKRVTREQRFHKYRPKAAGDTSEEDLTPPPKPPRKKPDQPKPKTRPPPPPPLQGTSDSEDSGDFQLPPTPRQTKRRARPISSPSQSPPPPRHKTRPPPPPPQDTSDSEESGEIRSPPPKKPARNTDRRTPLPSPSPPLRTRKRKRNEDTDDDNKVQLLARGDRFPKKERRPTEKRRQPGRPKSEKPKQKGPSPTQPGKRTRGRPKVTPSPPPTSVRQRNPKERWVTEQDSDIPGTSSSTPTTQSSSFNTTSAAHPEADEITASVGSPPSGIAMLLRKGEDAGGEEHLIMEEIALLARSKAVGTTKNYMSTLARFAKFLSPTPISKFTKIHFRDFLIYLTQNKTSYHFLTQLRPAIKWLEQILDREKSIFTSRTGLLFTGGLNIAADNRLPTKKGDAIPTRVLRRLIEDHVLIHSKDIMKIDALIFRCIMKVQGLIYVCGSAYVVYIHVYRYIQIQVCARRHATMTHVYAHTYMCASIYIYIAPRQIGVHHF